MTRRRKVQDSAPDEQELELLIHGDVAQIEAAYDGSWDAAVRRLIAAGFPQLSGEAPYTFIDYLVITREKRLR